MSEARKKLKKDVDKHLFSGKQEEQEFVASRMSIDMIRRKEEEIKEAIKRKKEEFRLKREEKLVTLAHDIRVMIDDENKGIAYYGKLVKEVQELEWTTPLKSDAFPQPITVASFEIILNEEKEHLHKLQSYLNSIPLRKEKQKEKQPTHLPSGRPIPRRILQT